MKSRKMTISTIIIFLLILALVPSSFADTQMVIIDGIIRAYIPDNYIVLTKETIDSDEVKNKIGDALDLSYYKEFLNQEFVLIAFRDDYESEISISVMENSYTKEVDDFSNYDSQDLADYQDILLESDEYKGTNTQKGEIAQSGQAKAVTFYTSSQTDDGTVYYTASYQTVKKGKAYTFSIITLNASDWDADKELIDQVFKTSNFIRTTAPANTNNVNVSDAGGSVDKNDGVYTDPLAKISYKIPSGWEEAEFNTSKEFLNAKFKKDNSLIMVGSSDIWSMLSAEEKQGYTKDEYNISAISDEDIEELVGVGDDIPDLSVSRKEYDGLEFIEISYPTSIEIMGQKITSNTTMDMTILNGYIISFQLQDPFENDYKNEYYTVLRSVNALNNKNPVSTDTDNTSKSDATDNTENKDEKTKEDDNKNTDFGWVTIFLLFAIIGGIVFYVVSKEKKEASAKVINSTDQVNTERNIISNTSTANDYSTDGRDYPINIDAVDRTERKVQFCRKCGFKLLPDSAFCSKCGSKVENVNY